MIRLKGNTEDNGSAKERIKQAAKELFQKNGFDATRTRDIAALSGTNIALLNYYFSGKDQLFQEVAIESVHEVFNSIKGILHDPTTDLRKKIELTTNSYYDLFEENPNLPFFVMTRLQPSHNFLNKAFEIIGDFPIKSYFWSQLCEHIERKHLPESPFQYSVNIVSLIIFPFIAVKPIMAQMPQIDTAAVRQFIEERRRLIPQWVAMMLQLD